MPKKVLFVAGERSVSTSSLVASILREHFEIVPHINLTHEVLDVVKKHKNLDAMVTHVPPSNYVPQFKLGRMMWETELSALHAVYKNSLDLIATVKEIHPMPVVAYSGAGGRASLVFGKPIDAYIQTSMNPKEDASSIESALEIHWRKPELARLASQPIPRPPLKQENGFTTIKDVVVNLDEGLDITTTASLYRECKKYPKRIILDFIDDGNLVEVNARDYMELCMHAYLGVKLKIKVEGLDQQAQTTALRLYSAFNSYDSRNIKFDRVFL